jgi:hypothetical protein
MPVPKPVSSRLATLAPARTAISASAAPLAAPQSPRTATADTSTNIRC